MNWMGLFGPDAASLYCRCHMCLLPCAIISPVTVLCDTAPAWVIWRVFGMEERHIYRSFQGFPCISRGEHLLLVFFCKYLSW